MATCGNREYVVLRIVGVATQPRYIYKGPAKFFRCMMKKISGDGQHRGLLISCLVGTGSGGIG